MKNDNKNIANKNDGLPMLTIKTSSDVLQQQRAGRSIRPKLDFPFCGYETTIHDLYMMPVLAGSSVVLTATMMALGEKMFENLQNPNSSKDHVKNPVLERMLKLLGNPIDLSVKNPFIGKVTEKGGNSPAPTVKDPSI